MVLQEALSLTSLSKSDRRRVMLRSTTLAREALSPCTLLMFLKGKILPFQETSHVHRTLKEELLVEEEGSGVDRNIFSLRPLSFSSSSFSTKGTWREMLGLKRTHVRSKITDEVSEANVYSMSQDHKTISGNVATECQVADT
ncbi:PREDICTED: uncharacterized protein LOC104711608 [Camelina sativa]|uniref:Uncharacterized protein LOC104711608 n=1 Tax=Camelina sativa TaxID=90675 RepID=A0ABM0THS1_CAMSA|nr:PREDICTED: uncharacterized protein LOC104711608 [Camelina sativa]